MKVGAPREVYDSEKRVSMAPDSAALLRRRGYQTVIEAGAGAAAGGHFVHGDAEGTIAGEAEARNIGIADLGAKNRGEGVAAVISYGPACALAGVRSGPPCRHPLLRLRSGLRERLNAERASLRDSQGAAQRSP